VILDLGIDPETGDLTSRVAQTLLQFNFTPADRSRMDELAEKVSIGTLTPKGRKVRGDLQPLGLLPNRPSQDRMGIHIFSYYSIAAGAALFPGASKYMRTTARSAGLMPLMRPA